MQADAAATAEKRAKAVIEKDEAELRRNKALLHEAFPGIPEASAATIMKHSFLKGSGRVGRTTVLTDEARIELAVNAHIRHKMTVYDSLFNVSVDYNNRAKVKRAARLQVFDRVQSIAKSWRKKSISNQSKSRLIRADETTRISKRKQSNDRPSRRKQTVKARTRTDPTSKISIRRATKHHRSNPSDQMRVTAVSSAEFKRIKSKHGFSKQRKSMGC